jgi:tetratricopeptide (TPR) repeat protein
MRNPTTPAEAASGRALALVLVPALAVAGCAAAPRLTLSPNPSAATTALVADARRLLHQAGDPAGAEAAARKALARDPASARAHAMLARLARLREAPAATYSHWMAALADARSRSVELYLGQIPLWDLGQSQLRRLAALLEQISRVHPHAGSRAAALAFLHGLQIRLGDAAGAKKTLERRALIHHWMAIGGFDNEDGKGYDTPYPPEREVAFARSYPGQRGRVSWRQLELAGPGPALELEQVFYPFSWNVAYLVTHPDGGPGGQRAVLELVTASPVKVWLNGRLLLAVREVRYVRFRQFRVPAKLRPGRNRLVIKSCQRTGAWRVGAWFARPDGTPLPLSSTARHGAAPRDRAAPLPWVPDRVLPPSVLAMPDGLDRTLWTAISLAAAGLRSMALGHLSRYLDARPGDPWALLQGVRLFRLEGQLQMATQLVERGLKLPAPYAARFWVERARLLQERGQHDKAFEALDRARGMAPGGLSLARQWDRLMSSKGWTLDRLQQARDLQRRYPDWVWPADLLARAYSGLGRPLQASRWLRRAVGLEPMEVTRRNRLVYALLGLGRCNQALSLQRQTTDLWPGRSGPRAKLGDALRRCGHPDQARQAYEQASRLNPDWNRPYQRLGLLRYEAGDRQGAVAMWRKALRRRPDDSNLWDRVSHLQPDHDPILERHRASPQQIAAAVARGRTLRPAEGASIAWLLDHEVSRLMPDGTLKRIITTVRLAIDRTGRDRLGEERLPEDGQVRVLDAYTVDPGGRRMEVTSMHGRTVRFPALKEGSVVVLQYRHTRRPTGYLRHHFDTTWVFQHRLEQVLNSQWILALPADRKLNTYIQGQVRHQQRREGELMIHTFSSSDVPPLRPEANSPPAADLLRLVKVSTVPSWDYFSEWGRSLTSEVFEIDPRMERVLSQLVAGKQSTEDKIRAVYRLALTRIRYQQDYETFIAGVKPHPASVVLQRGYGDCKDKSVLIIAMLRRLGLKAYLALVRTRGQGQVRAGVPSQQFNHAVVYLPPQPGLQDRQGRFLDATAENLDIDVLRGDVQGTLALVLFEDKYRLIRVPYQAPEKSRTAAALSLELAADGSAQLRLLWSMRGYSAGKLRKPLQNRQLQRQVAQAAAHQLYPDCSLEQVQVQGQRSVLRPLELRLGVRCSEAARREGRQLRLRLPKLFSQFSAMSRWTERRHPLLLGPPELSESSLALKLPPGTRVRSVPDDHKLSGPCVELSGRWERGQGVLRYLQRIRRTCAQLEASDYPAFRGALTRFNNTLEREVVLEVK